MTMFKRPNRQQSGSLVGEHSLSSEWGRSLRRGSPGRLQAARERADAKSKDRRQVRLLGGLSGKGCWRVVHDETTVWRRVSVEELVKRRLGMRADWGERVS